MLVSVPQQRARQQINCVYNVVCVHVCANLCQCVLWNFFIIISVLAATAAVAAAAEAATCHLMPTLHVPLLHVVFAFCGATIACHAHRVRQR